MRFVLQERAQAAVIIADVVLRFVQTYRLQGLSSDFLMVRNDVRSVNLENRDNDGCKLVRDESYG